MPIPLPKLDDRQFADLAEEMRTRITQYAPEWTNHNIADPGIMLMELFAWLTEAYVYRINRVPESSRISFLQILGVIFKPAQPATVKLKVSASVSRTLPAGTLLKTSPYDDEEVLWFETLRDVSLTGQTVSAYVPALQIARVEDELLGIGTGENFQLFELAQPFIVLPEAPPPTLPKVCVGDELWTYTADMRASEPGDKHFTIKEWLNAIAFGDGEHGQARAEGNRITVSYREASRRFGIIEEAFTATGKPQQFYRLQEKIVAPEPRQSNMPPPVVTVNGLPWKYRAGVIEMGPDGSEFTVDPARNSIRFGANVHGNAPPLGSEIRASYRYTQRQGREIEPGIHLWTSDDELDGLASEELAIVIEELISPGSDATGIDEAHILAHDILKPRWRAISSNDFETIVENSDIGVARAQCLPGQNLDAPREGVSSTGHVSVVVVPEARHQIDLQTQGLIEVLDYCPDGSSVVGLSDDDRGWLVLLENQGASIDLGPFGDEATRKSAFSADGQRLIAAGEDKVAVLYSTGDGNELTRFTPASDVKFSPAGKYVVEITESGEARLWDARDATVIVRWSPASPAEQALFSADDSLLATTNAEEGDDDVQLWKTRSGELQATLHHPGRIVEMIFSDDAKQLITAAEDGQIYLWLTKSARLRAKISSGQTARDLIVNGDGTRLLVFDERRAWLWSTRSRRRMVDSSLGDDIVGARFSPDGNWLAVSHEDGVVRLWDAKRGAEIGAFDHGAAFQLAFSPNSRRLVTLATEPAMLRLWDLQTVRDGFDPLTHFESTAAAISSDGSWFCYADGNLLRLWSTDEKRQISVLYNDRSHGQIKQMRGITQGKYLYVASQHEEGSDSTETIHIWNAEHVPDVWRLVNERRLITSEHHVAGPTYTDVYIETKIALSQPTKTMTRFWQDNVIQALYEFFHPLRGGPDGGGWPFGRDVYASEIYQILESIDGVDYVESLTMGIQPDNGVAVEQGGPRLISVPPFHLVHLVVNPDAITFTG